MEQVKEGFKDLFYSFSKILKMRLLLPASLFPFVQPSFQRKLVTLNHLFPPFIFFPLATRDKLACDECTWGEKSICQIRLELHQRIPLPVATKQLSRVFLVGVA